MKTRIWLTGSKGQIARVLRPLLEPQYEVWATSHQEVDISNRAMVFQVASIFRPHIVINAAAYTHVDHAQQQTTLANAVNHFGAMYLAQAARQQQALLIHLSTDYVFDGLQTEAYSETSTTNPCNIYGQTKLAGEQSIIAICEHYLILRTAWVFSQYGQNFVRTIWQLAQQNQVINMVNDQYGMPTYALDIAYVILAIIQQWQQHSPLPNGIYHFSGSQCMSKYQYTQGILQSIQAQGLLSTIPRLQAISSQDYSAMAKRPPYVCLDNQKIQAALNISRQEWQQALDNTLRQIAYENH